MIITSIQNGNWSDTSTWDSGTVPGINDDVVIAHQIDADQSFIEVNSITTNGAPIGARRLNLVEDIIFISTESVVTGNGNGQAVGLFFINSNITFTLQAPSFNIGNGVSNFCIRINSVCNPTIIGDLNSSANAASSNALIISNLSLTCNIIGNITAGAANGVIGGSNVSFNIIGNIFAGGGAGVSASSVMNIIGNVFASTENKGIQSNNLTINGFAYNVDGRVALDVNTRLYIDTPVMEWLVQRSDNSDRFLYTAGVPLGNPDTTDVREDVEYGPNQELTGELVIPDENSVALGVQFDVDKIGTAMINIQQMGALLASFKND